MTLVEDRPMVESREHLEQSDGQLKKLIAGEAWEMRQELVHRGNPIDTYKRSCGSLSVGRTQEYYGSSTVGEVRKDVAQGWTSAESWEGHSRYELRLGGYFIPNTSRPTFEFEFRMKEVQRDFHCRSYPLKPHARSPSDILAFNACVLESFQIRTIRRDLSKFSLVRWPRYDAVMALSAVSRF